MNYIQVKLKAKIKNKQMTNINNMLLLLLLFFNTMN